MSIKNELAVKQSMPANLYVIRSGRHYKDKRTRNICIYVYINRR